MQEIHKRKPGVIEHSEDLWSLASAHLRVVFSQRHIPAPMEAILNGPMGVNEGERRAEPASLGTSWSFVRKKDQASHCLQHSDLCVYNSREVFFSLHSY
jgi:hypothetical protein